MPLTIPLGFLNGEAGACRVCDQTQCRPLKRTQLSHFQCPSTDVLANECRRCATGDDVGPMACTYREFRKRLLQARLDGRDSRLSTVKIVRSRALVREAVGLADSAHSHLGIDEVASGIQRLAVE